MRTARWLAGTALPVILLGGCQSMNNTEKGALTGGGIGAGAGALIGHATGHTGAGAVIGGLTGGLIGGAVGNDMDKEKAKQERIAAAEARQLQITDVATMAQQHLSDGIIINQIRTTGSVYHLSTDEIVWLRQQGVSEGVIAEMQATAYRPLRRVYTPAPVVVVEQPPPPVSVGIGVGFHGR
jgi:outer membrane lipoprotein SlyB